MAAHLYMSVCRYLLPFQLADLHAEPFPDSHIACVAKSVA